MSALTLPLAHRAALCGLLGLLAAGCTAWRVQAVPVTESIRDRSPTSIRVTQRDGTRHVLSLPRIVGDSVQARQRTMATADVTQVAVRRFDPIKTLGLIAAIPVTAAMVCLATDCFELDWGWTSSGSRPQYRGVPGRAP